MSFHATDGQDAIDYRWIFRSDPCNYDNSDPHSSYVKYMREQDELFYATFPAADEHRRLKNYLLNHYRTHGSLPDHPVVLPNTPYNTGFYSGPSNQLIFPPIPLHFDYRESLKHPQDYGFQVATTSNSLPMLDHATPERSYGASSLTFQPKDEALELVSAAQPSRPFWSLPNVFDTTGVPIAGGHSLAPHNPTFSLPLGGTQRHSGSPPLTSPDSNLDSLSSQIEAPASWDAYTTPITSQITNTSSAASPTIKLTQLDRGSIQHRQQHQQQQLPQLPSNQQQPSLIRRPTHRIPPQHHETKQHPPSSSSSPPSPSSPAQTKITHDKKGRKQRSGRDSSTPPSGSGRSRTASSSQMSKTAGQTGLSWSSKKNSRTATMRLSPLPSTKRQVEKKPPLACLFCRGRKIACGAPLPGSVDKTCNQCQRRSLPCEYPAESRRGMRKKKMAKGHEDGLDETLSLPGESILIP